MSIPGFNGGSVPVEANTTAEVTIPHKSEWRFEVPFKTILKLKVTAGVGEVFGTELPFNIEFLFTGVKYSIYAPLAEGCTVSYYTVANKENINISNEDGEIVEYISEETAMDHYLNLHFILELYRQEAALLGKLGPRVLVVGNGQSGKTTLARILSSYAFKMDKFPVLVNLNPKDGVFSLPGSITATPISDFFDLQSVGGWGSSPTSGTSIHNPKQPLVKNYGFSSIHDNLDLYKYQVSKLGVAAISRLTDDDYVKSSGLIIDTPPLTTKDFTVIENIVSDFEVNIVVVIGNERLTIDLKKKFGHKMAKNQLNILKVPKSGGVVEVDDFYTRKLQEETIKEYFNGNSKSPLSPFKTEIEIKDFVLYKGVLLLEYTSSLAFLPSGDSYTAEEPDGGEDKKEDNALNKYYSRLTEVTPSNLENSIIAITQVSQNNQLSRDLLNACVMGYAHVSKVEDNGRAKILLPFPGAFPRNILIGTNIGYAE